MVPASPIDLMVLGLLMESPRNAYELVRLVDDRQLNRLLKISRPAVYKSCKRLSRGKFLDGQTVRDGELPEKVIYSVNAAGAARFRELMEYYSKEIMPIYFNFNSFLWNIEKLDRTEALTRLKELQRCFKSTKTWIECHTEQSKKEGGVSFAGKMIMKQYHMLLSTLVQWIAETIKEFNRQKA